MRVVLCCSFIKKDEEGIDRKILYSGLFTHSSIMIIN